MKKIFLLTILLLIFEVSLAFAATPVIFFSDLTSGPKTGGQNNKGVFVTIKGKNFGATQGTSHVSIGGGQADNYPVWSDTKISFQLGANAATGNITVTTSGGTSNGVSFTVRNGNIYFIALNGSDSANGSYTTPWQTWNYAKGLITAGDTLYYRAGTWTGINDYGVIGFRTAHSGSSGNPTAVLTYPGETVTLYPNGTGNGIGMNFYDDAGDLHDIVIGGFIIDAIRPISVAATNNLRIVNCDVRNGNKYGSIECAYGTDNVEILGNRVYNSSTSNNRLYHAIYVANASNGINISYNDIDTVGAGRGIQIHEDTGEVFQNITISNNIIHNVGRDGILLSTNCQDANVFNNILYDTGLLEYAGIRVNTAAASPNIKIYNNVVYHCGEGDGTGGILIENCAVGGVTARDNIIYQNSGVPYWSFGVGTNAVVASNNCYYGNGNGPTWDTNRVNSNPLLVDLINHDFHLQSTSPAKDAGYDTTTIVTRDYDGIARPQSTAVDIGAYEYAVDSIPPAAVTDLGASSVTSTTVVLGWTAPGNDGNFGRAASYDIRYSASTITTDADWASATQVSGEPSPSSAGTIEIFTVSGLTASTTYYFALKTTDYAANTSSISNVASATTSAVSSGGGGGGGGGCFIATAVYGSPMAKEEQILIMFRDKRLLKNKTGKKLVELYYKVSPPIAEYIGKREWAKRITRGMLRPIIWFANITVGK
jgi:hypothetical protein